jgi:hypothetical protein
MYGVSVALLVITSFPMFKAATKKEKRMIARERNLYMSENDRKDWVLVPEEENMREPVEVAPAIRVGDFMVRDVEAFLNVERPEIYHIYEMRMKDRNKQTDGDEIW